jgi:hypothetical protein
MNCMLRSGVVRDFSVLQEAASFIACLPHLGAEKEMTVQTRHSSAGWNAFQGSRS